MKLLHTQRLPSFQWQAISRHWTVAQPIVATAPAAAAATLGAMMAMTATMEMMVTEMATTAMAKVATVMTTDPTGRPDLSQSRES
ncbi:hypothetical protein [Rhizobium halophilum]|uniref:hypothetical protein n=1 Tax=Rhizobium halophilum TaxID=2846852 RepID=UPI001EFE857A|nr:hypothetical protein [Rhizobium halophilum]MCF6370696.1 hypothetical protein [Rhizobium halophilum]